MLLPPQPHGIQRILKIPVEARHKNHHDQQARHRVQHIEKSHHATIHTTARIPAHHPVSRTDHQTHQRADQTHAQAYLGTRHQPIKEVVAIQIRSQQMKACAVRRPTQRRKK